MGTVLCPREKGIKKGGDAISSLNGDDYICFSSASQRKMIDEESDLSNGTAKAGGR